MITEGTLNICNGQPDETFGHRDHTSQNAPYIVQCLTGVVTDFDRMPRVHPLSAATGGDAEPGRPPHGGVEGLVITQNADGSLSLDYSYEGQDCFIRYAPSGTENCCDFTTSTVTNDGALMEGGFCR